MEKGICKIKINEVQGTGFFCKIPFPNINNILSVLITNNHIINKNILNKIDEDIDLKIKEKNHSQFINLNNRIKYTNENFDITIIEIKKEDNIQFYLELDDIIINNIINKKDNVEEYIDETIYLIQYPEGKLSVSFGIIHSIYSEPNHNFNHICSTRGGSSGSPILNSNNNKIIGVHKEGLNKYNIGTFLNYPINEFIQQYYQLQEFKKKYNINKDEYKIDLSKKNIDNFKFSLLSELELNEIKELYLNDNVISNIKSFK